MARNEALREMTGNAAMVLDVAAVLRVIACSEALSRKLPPRRAAHVPQTWKVFNCKPPPSQANERLA
jgi:hypothetical protein